ncbi:MAG: hypothetical protein ONB23_02820 [candidate division KSB1 bacterium]|nr:hypothetical protein [candidate division KSB1 bacterium]
MVALSRAIWSPLSSLLLPFPCGKRRGISLLASVWLLLLPGGGLPSVGRAADTTVVIRDLSLAEKRVTLHPAASGEVFLPDSFIVAGSVRVELGGSFLPDSCFRVDYGRARIRFLCVPETAEVTVHYRALSLPVPRLLRGLEYVRHRSDTAPREPAPDTRPSRRLWEPKPGLRQSGTLVRGFTIGTGQALSVQSGLRMQLSGRLADRVEIQASLSDKNTPIQPQGNTQTLREIDNVFVEIRAPSTTITLGDFSLEFDGGRLDRVSRRLEGGKMEVRAGRAEVSLVGATSRGKFTTNSFLGREGVQGPYQLHGEEGQTAIVVVAGSERVWVDGVLMSRGEDRDYVIDYGTAQLTFTRRRLITGESRIVVDFQYSDERYPRSFYAGRLQLSGPDGTYQVRTTFVRESDDADRPLAGSLDARGQAVLAVAGDSARLAFVDGARYVGAGKGTYVRRDSVFEFVGVGKGDYEVTFSEVGEGRGDYVYEGVGRFSYAGKNKGKYLPVLLIPLPARGEQLSTSISARPFSPVVIESELALSRFDRNLRSSRDDGDNVGSAGLLRLRLDPEPFRWGKVTWEAQVRQVGSRFHEIHRMQEVEYARQWDLPPKAGNAESVLETRGHLESALGLKMGAGWGSLYKPGSFFSQRFEWTAGFQRQGLPGWFFQEERISRRAESGAPPRHWIRRRGEVSWKTGQWVPGLEYESESKSVAERREWEEGFAFERLRAGLQRQAPRGLAGGLSAEIRTDDRQKGDLLCRYSVAKTGQLQLLWRPAEVFTSSASLIHRQRRYRWGTEANTTTDLIEVQAAGRPLRGALLVNANYQVSKEQVARQERLFVRVEGGMGNYRFDPVYGEYVPDPFGDFVLRFVPTDEYVPVTSLRAGLNLQVDLSRAVRGTSGRLAAFLRDLSSEVALRLEEQTRYPRPRDIYLMCWNCFQNPAYTLMGSRLQQLDLHYRRGRRDGSLRLRWSQKASLSNAYLEAGQRSVGELISALVLVSPLPRLSTELELEERAEARHYLGPGVDRDVSQRRLRLQGSYRWNLVFETGLGLTLGRGQDRAVRPPTDVELVALEPRLTVSLRQRGRVVLEGRWARLSSRPAVRSVPYEMAEGLQTGTSFGLRASAEYSLGSGMTASLQYVARSDPYRPQTVHRLQVEVRASF